MATATTTPTPPPPQPRKRSSLPTTVIGPRITNIVCGMNLNCRFDLRHIALLGRNVDYKPKRFPACILRLREPSATALVFATGKMQVLGTKSIEDAKLASRKFARMLQKMGYQPRMEDWNVQNVVGNADVGMVVRLQGLARAHYEYTHFEPEVFPGLIYSMNKSAARLAAEAEAGKASTKKRRKRKDRRERKIDNFDGMKVLVFSTGKLVFLGARDPGEIEEALRGLYFVLFEFRIPPRDAKK